MIVECERCGSRFAWPALETCPGCGSEKWKRLERPLRTRQVEERDPQRRIAAFPYISLLRY